MNLDSEHKVERKSSPNMTTSRQLNGLKEVKTVLNHRYNPVNIGYLSITHLLSLLAFIPIIYAPPGFLKVMLIYLVIHSCYALISTTAYAHRLISHGATRRVNTLVHLLFGYLGQTLAAQGSLASWAGKHRVHHAVDGNDRHDEDPYSAVWFTSAWRNFLWSHVLCYCFESPHEEGVYLKKTEGVLRQHKIMRWQHEHYMVFLILFTKLTPFALGFWFGGTLWAGLCLLWTSILAIVISQNVTWSVNSVTHMWGVSAARSSAKNNYFWLLPLGEGNHHADHHDAPTDYRNGFGFLGWLLDPTRYVLLSLRLLRLVGPLQKTSRVTELKMIIDRKVQALVRKKLSLSKRLKLNEPTSVSNHFDSSLMLEQAKDRATELWTYYESSLNTIKADLIERAQKLERLKAKHARYLTQRSQDTREQMTSTLSELKLQLKIARRELKIEWSRFQLEVKSAQKALSYDRLLLSN